MGTFLSVSCRNNINRRKNMGFSLVCVEKKKAHLKNMFNVSKQLCCFLAQGYCVLLFSTQGSTPRNCTTLLKRGWSARFLVSKKSLPRELSRLGRSVVSYYIKGEMQDKGI